jgi:Zn-dependent protease with chaperone function
MSLHRNFRKQLVRITIKAMLALFLIPVATLVLAHHFRQSTDARYQQELMRDISAQADMLAAEKSALLEKIQSVKPSDTCFGTGPENEQYRDSVCSRYSELWQFAAVEKTALWTLIGSTTLMLIVIALGALAFARREIQYLSFAFGWRIMSLFTAAEVLIQGVFVVWLSFWITAFFFEVYAVKLIAIAGVLAALAVLTVILAVFQRINDDTSAFGKVVSAEDAPILWNRIRQLANVLLTAPPQQIVAGIDANFFVTEHPLVADGRKFVGRTLFVSIPLLRILDQTEADAVLAHELGHFAGGDTRNSAALGPLLARYDLYSQRMHEGGLTNVVAYVLDFYRVVFEIAMQRSNREREFAADCSASQATSPEAIVNALIKISAYASYRGKVEHALFSHNLQYDAKLDIADRISQGLSEFSHSAEFLNIVRGSEIPHPFDSHPSLTERMRNVGYEVPEAQFSSIANKSPEACWVDSIGSASMIEQMLWTEFENSFSEEHEASLAYRYLPETDAEKSLVLRYFPPLQFALKKSKSIEVNFEGIVHPETGAMLPWDMVAGLQFDEPAFRANRLVVTHPEKGLIGAKTTSISIAIERKERELLGQALAKYWTRHKTARAHLTS